MKLVKEIRLCDYEFSDYEAQENADKLTAEQMEQVENWIMDDTDNAVTPEYLEGLFLVEQFPVTCFKWKDGLSYTGAW